MKGVPPSILGCSWQVVPCTNSSIIEESVRTLFLAHRASTSALIICLAIVDGKASATLACSIAARPLIVASHALSLIVCLATVAAKSVLLEHVLSGHTP